MSLIRNIATYLRSSFSRLGGVAVSVLATGPKGRGFKSGRGDGFLRAIKIHSTPSFGWEISQKPHVLRFYGMLKNLA
jgi:hypothetical protein